MRYLTKTLDFDSRGDSVVTLGKFDGLHRGHMLLIRRVLAIGRTEGLETVVFTFDVPPQSKVQHVKPHQLLTNEERRARLEQLGMDCLVECPFVDEVMHMTPEAFIKEILVDKLHAKKVVVGKDFGFGYKRSGTAEMLKEMGPSLGFGVWQDVKILNMDILSFMDFITISVLMPVGALLTCLFVGYVIGVDTVEDEVMLSSRFRRRKMYRVFVKYVAPVFIVAILISSVLNSYNIITL